VSIQKFDTIFSSGNDIDLKSSEYNGQFIHKGVSCDVCNMNPILGNRYKCTACYDYDLCENCEIAGSHPVEHELIKFKQPSKIRMNHRFGGGGGQWRHHGGHHPWRKWGECHRNNADMNSSVGQDHPCRKWRNSKLPRQPSASPAPPVEGMGAEFIRDVTISKATVMTRGHLDVKTWCVRNNGNMDWDQSVRLEYLTGNRELLMDDQQLFEVAPLKAGQVGDINVPITVPNQPGFYKTVFRMTRNGEEFGDHLLIIIRVQ